jgi:hypothetical protein
VCTQVERVEINSARVILRLWLIGFMCRCKLRGFMCRLMLRGIGSRLRGFVFSLRLRGIGSLRGCGCRLREGGLLVVCVGNWLFKQVKVEKDWKEVERVYV